MDTKSLVAQYRGEQWIQILQELKESGKTVKVFCRERNLSLNAYYYWQRKLREAALENLQKSSSSSNIAPKGWMQLAEVNSAKEKIEIEINGCNIKVDNNTDTNLLKQICNILRSL